MYDQPPQDISALFAPFSQQIKTLGEAIRAQIKEALPQATENIYGGKKVANVLYSIDGKNNVICGMQPGDGFVRVFFHHWQRLQEAGYAVEGSGKNARHVKIASKEDLDALDLKTMLALVMRDPG